MKLKPMEQFICDECGEVIEKIEDGWLEWIDNTGNPIHGFRIVHASGRSPRFKNGGNCYYPEYLGISDNHLEYFTGMNGLAYLLSIFDRNLRDPKELVEIIRRLHIAYYEEARLFLKRAIEEGFIDCWDDTQVILKRVIVKYGS
jgi:hypothetical protein